MVARLMKAPPKRKIQAPKTVVEWSKLMTNTIARASESKSKLLPGLRDAQARGQVEPYLRRLGIIHQNDIDRLFSHP